MLGIMLVLDCRCWVINSFYFYGIRSLVYIDNNFVMVRINYLKVFKIVYIKVKKFFKYYMLIWLFFLVFYDKLILEFEWL